MDYKVLFEHAKQKNIKNIQITETTLKISQLEVINKKLDTYENSNTVKYSIKAEYNGKTVKLTSDYLDEDILDLIIMKSSYTDSSYQDDYLTNITENNQLIDTYTNDVSETLKRMYELDKYRMDNNKVNKLVTYYNDVYEQKRIVNNNGVDIKTASHLHDFSVEVVIENNGSFASFDKTYLKAKMEELQMESYVQEAIDKCIKLSQKDKLVTKKYNVVFDSKVISTILSQLVLMLSATNIRKKMSCLENKLNKKIFSDKLTIIEDPTENLYPGYTIFDDEGTKTTKKTIIDEGILKTYLYDIKEAKEKNVKSTANGYGKIETRNLYVKAGESSLDEMFKEMKNGIYITDSMGSMDTAININTGDISLQVFGFIIENGRIVNGFEPCVLTTTVFELLTNIQTIGNNLEFRKKSVGSPAILIENLSIAGSK